MANGAIDPLLEKTKFFREHVQTVLGLATGSFVLSVTFLHDQTGHLHGVQCLRLAWEILGVSILLGLAYNYVLTIFLNVKGKHFDTSLSVLSLLFHGSFVLSMYYLLRFGLSNI